MAGQFVVNWRVGGKFATPAILAQGVAALNFHQRGLAVLHEACGHLRRSQLPLDCLGILELEGRAGQLLPWQQEIQEKIYVPCLRCRSRRSPTV